VGEQSNAYRILLRYDRKSRHRRIKKQRRYERLAATSQFLGTARSAAKALPTARFGAPTPLAGLRLSAGSSPYLKPLRGRTGGAHSFPSVAQRPFTAREGRRAAGHLLEVGLLPSAAAADPHGWPTFWPALGTHPLQGFPATSRVAERPVKPPAGGLRTARSRLAFAAGRLDGPGATAWD
jgi:hypothetical protein